MGACTCGYSTDPEKNCNGTHNVVKAVKADIIAKLEAGGHADAAETLKAKQIPSSNNVIHFYDKRENPAISDGVFRCYSANESF